MTEFELEAARRPHRRRGLSGLGLLLVVVGLLAVAINYSRLPPRLFGLWPLAFVAVGLFGLVRRPGWVGELDLQFGTQVSRALDRPHRLFSLLLLAFGCLCLPFTLGVVSTRLVGPILLVALGLLLLWRRAR
jgi:4-amino-4-deoxy-L-arabinose transferase-like glycosyltransferase